MAETQEGKHLEAKLEAEKAKAHQDIEEDVPAYEAGPSTQPAQATNPPDEQPPLYPTPTIPFAEGDPDEMIEVPFIVSHASNSLKKFLTGKTVVKQRVTTRAMRRSMYLEKYAKDSEGNFAGTSQPAADAKMVYVAAMDKDDMKKAQVDTAFGKEHYGNSDWLRAFGSA